MQQAKNYNAEQVAADQPLTRSELEVFMIINHQPICRSAAALSVVTVL